MITLSADWLTCRSCGCHPPARSCPPDSPAAINNVGGKSSQDFLNCANDGATLTHRATGWILQRLAIDRMSVAATAQALGVGWELVNQVAVDACRQLVYDNPSHLGGVRILGVDESCVEAHPKARPAV